MATKNEKVEHIDTLGRTDGWQNVVTGIGTSQDKKNYNQVFWNQRSPEFFEQMYAGDELASRIVNVVPEEGLREWVEWLGVPKNIAKAVEKKAQQLDLRGAIERTWKWGRAYGGACLYIVTDTRDPGGPLRIGERVIGLRDLSRYDLRIMSTDVESDFGAANFGHPNVYYLTVQMGSQFKGYPIHWTRMVRFDGYLVPRRTFIRNNYWHDSILNRLYNPIRNYQSSNDAVATMLQDFNVDVYKMKNLANMISAGKEDIVKKRLEILNFSKSMIRAMLLDSDDEEYENQQRSIEGVAELLTKQANRLVAATDIPHTKLLGESPDGSNATGNSTTQQWYNHVRAEQNNYLRPKLRRLVEAIFYDVKDLDFKFNSLHQNTEAEEAEIRNKTAQTDQIYLSTGVIDPTEVAESRFGTGEYSMETKLNLEARQAGLLTPHDGGLDLPDPTDPNDPMGGAGNPEDPSQNPIGSPEPPKSGALKPKSGQTAQADAETYPVANTALPEGTSEPMAKLNEVGGPDASHLAPEQDEDEEEELPESLKEFQPDEMGIETDRPGTGYELNNSAILSKTKKVEQMIGISISDPMRDPKTDPRMPAPNTPKKPRMINPTVGNASTSPSGAQFKTDAGALEEQMDAFEPKKHEGHVPMGEDAHKKHAKEVRESLKGMSPQQLSQHAQDMMKMAIKAKQAGLHTQADLHMSHAIAAGNMAKGKHDDVSQKEIDDGWITMSGAHVLVGKGGKHESGPLKGQEHKPKGAAKKKPAEGGHKASPSAPSHGGGSEHGGGLLEALSEGAEKASQAAEHDRQDAGVLSYLSKGLGGLKEAASRDADPDWITMHGAHVPIEEGVHKAGPLKGAQHKPAEKKTGAANKPKEQQSSTSVKPHEEDKEAAFMALAGSIPDKDYESFENDFEKAFASAKVEKANTSNAKDFMRAHGENMQTNTQRPLKAKARGKDLKDPSIGVRINGKIYMLDGQHRLNQALAEGRDQNVVVLEGEHFKKYPKVQQSIMASRTFGGVGSEASKKDAEPSSDKNAASVAVMYKDTILMGKRRDSGKWTLPGGHIKKDEDPQLGALRELQEETGIKAMPHQLDDMEPSDLENGGKLHKFVLRLGGPKPTTARMDPDGEVATWIWVPTHGGLPSHVKENLHHNPNGVLDALGL